MRAGLLALSILMISAPAYAKAARFDLPAVAPVLTQQTRKVEAPEPVTLPPGEARSLVKKSQEVNLGPLPLLESEEERAKNSDFLREREAQQLMGLWSSTLERSPDIQVVISMLQPQSDPKHAKSSMMKMVGGLVSGAGQVAPLALPNSGLMRFGTGIGISMLDNAWRGSQKGDGKPISEATIAVGYSMIRRTADRLTDAYRGYKNSLDALVIDEEAAEDCKKMIEAVNDDRASALLLDFSIRRTQRDVRKSKIDTYAFRAQLVDLCGAEAVAKLDEQIAEERRVLVRATGQPTWRPELNFKSPRNAELQK